MRLAAGRQWDAGGCLLLPPSRCRPLAGSRRRAASWPARGALGCVKAAAMPRRSAEGQGMRANAPPHGTATASGSAAMRPRALPGPSSAWLISSRPPAPRPPAAPPQPAARAYAVTPRAVRCTPSGCASAAPGRGRQQEALRRGACRAARQVARPPARQRIRAHARRVCGAAPARLREAAPGEAGGCAAHAAGGRRAAGRRMLKPHAAAPPGSGAAHRRCGADRCGAGALRHRALGRPRSLRPPGRGPAGFPARGRCARPEPRP